VVFLAPQRRVLADPETEPPDEFVYDRFVIQAFSPFGVHTSDHVDLFENKARGYR
jgi:hypothetical protein